MGGLQSISDTAGRISNQDLHFFAKAKVDRLHLGSVSCYSLCSLHHSLPKTLNTFHQLVVSLVP